ncbi:MAG: class I SAM-dependent methyltransferase [Microbacterium sp.]|uniref:class I SAM-dependent methyltransferase n=1 Tax=Microbacterium sp. TaxID=51671 RepID=UPI003A860726
MSDTFLDPVQSRINAYWSARAPEYDASQLERQQRPGAEQVWGDVWTAALPPAPADVLDLGTGSGNVALLLARLGYAVTGVDLADGMLAEARRKAEEMSRAPQFVEGDAVAPPFPAGSFDALTARYLLWTLRDPADALRAWRELLRPGGVLVAVDSLWYPEGIDAAEELAAANPHDDEFRVAYDAEARARLPLAEASDIQRTADMLTHAGFADVTVDELPEIMDLDRRYGVAPGHRVQLQYRLTARA